MNKSQLVSSSIPLNHLSISHRTFHLIYPNKSWMYYGSIILRITEWIIRLNNVISGLFHSFSKVLFIFPSRYFFAISFPIVFRLWCVLSPFQFTLPSKSTLFLDEYLITSLLIQGFHFVSLDFSFQFFRQCVLLIHQFILVTLQNV